MTWFQPQIPSVGDVVSTPQIPFMGDVTTVLHKAASRQLCVEITLYFFSSGTPLVSTWV